MKRITFGTLVLVFALILNCRQVWAQATAQISGRVQDTTGAVLPGAEVTATQTGTGIARTAITNRSSKVDVGLQPFIDQRFVRESKARHHRRLTSSKKKKSSSTQKKSSSTEKKEVSSEAQ